MFRIKAVLFSIGQDPGEHTVGVLQGGGEFVLRGQTVGEVDHGKAPLGKIHAVELIPLLVAVDPAAAVDADP